MIDAKIDANLVRGHFESSFRPAHLRFKAISTTYKWRLELDRLDRFLGRPAVLADLTDATVGDAAEWILSPQSKQGLGLSVETTRGFIGRIRKLWDFLARRRVVADFPTLENLRKQKRVPRAWTSEQLNLLWQAIELQPGMIGNLMAADWYCSLHAVMWCTGERVGALLQARWADIDLRGGYLVLQPSARKGGQIGRCYKLSGQSVEWLQRIVQPQRELVWPWPYSYGYLWTRYREILRCAGLPFADRNAKFHRMRKSHASHLHAAGGDATESLGHSNRATTVESYLDSTISRKSWPSDLLPPMGSGSR